MAIGEVQGIKTPNRLKEQLFSQYANNALLSLVGIE
jgi:hypothetical protein